MKNVGKTVRWIGGSIAVIGTLAFFISGYGYQWGWWGLGFAFGYLATYGAYLAFGGFILSFVGFLPGLKGSEGGAVKLAVIGFFLGGITLVTSTYWYQEAQKYPPIHDITTDIDNPPEFDAIVPLRKDAPNPTEYGGTEVAKIQTEHYPDIQTLHMNREYPTVFKWALETARSFPWEIVDYDLETGIIEATHTLPWYGFKDDVVIRVDTSSVDSTATMVDVRSVSRIGRGDIGVNAHRIKKYLDRLSN